MKKRLFSFLLLAFVSYFSLPISAITPDYISKKNIAEITKSVKSYQDGIESLADSVILYTRGANGLIVIPEREWEPFYYNITFRDTVIYDPLFLPVVFDGKILPRHLDFIPRNTTFESPRYHLIPQDSTLAPLIKRAEVVQDRRKAFYLDMNNVGDVRYNTSVLKSIPKLNEEDVTKRNFLNDLIATDDAVRITPVEIDKVQPGYIYWTKNGEHSLQVSQNYISSNWNGGGNSNYVIKNYHKFLVNYKKDKLTFNNVLEWKLNLQKVAGAEKHGTNISEDLLRLENTLGYQAFNKWSYSAKLETKTGLFDSYQVNSDKKNTAFLSPLIVNLGLGMSYSLEKKFQSDKTKKLKLSQSISPLSINFIYLNDTDVNRTSGVDVANGETTQTEFGSLVNTDLSFTFNRYMSWTSRFKYFTNYERVEIEFENRFVMSLSRFFSTTIQVYTRFDDRSSIERDADLGYFQLNEMVSFGFNYKW